MSDSLVPRGTFSALRVRDYRVYWSTGLVSNIGSAMQGVALDWFVLTLTHSGTAVGWAAGLQFAPVLIGVIGTGWVFAVNALSFAAVLVGLLTIRPQPRPAPPPTQVRTPWAAAGADGLHYVAARPELVAAFAIFGLVATFGMSFPTTLTLFAARVFDVGSSGLGFMSTALSVGLVAGALAAARRGSPRVRTVVVGALLFGVAEAVTALMPSYPAFLVLLLPTGFALMMVNTAVSAFVQAEVDNAVRGRVMAVYTVVSMGGTPLGGPVIGWISQEAGARWGMASGAAASVLAAVTVALWLSRLRRRTRVDAATGLPRRPGGHPDGRAVPATVPGTVPGAAAAPGTGQGCVSPR